MASSSSTQARPRPRLVLDFDGTITQKDTILVLASTAIARQQQRQQEHDSTDLAARWDQVVAAYLDDLKAYKDGYAVPESQRRTLAHEVAYQRGMADAEAASLARVRDSGVFAGLDAPTLRDMGREAVASGQVALRPGLARLVGEAGRAGWDVTVLSVNWSASFIRGVLSTAGGSSSSSSSSARGEARESGSGSSIRGLDDLDVVANEVVSSGGGIVNDRDRDAKPLTTSSDKLEALKRWCPAAPAVVLYMGDSTTDLECLLHGRGVVVADGEDKSSLIRTLRRLGLNVPHASQAREAGGAGGDGKDKSQVVFWASDFNQVLDSGLFPPE